MAATMFGLCMTQVLLVFLGVFANPASAQASWPQRPITLVVPFSAGGGTDSIARDIAKGMSERLGQSVVVENRGGAAGTIGANLVAKAKPDGYTLLFATSTFATSASVAPKLAFDPDTDFVPVAMIGRGPLLLVTGKHLNVTSVAQLLARGQTSADGLNFCSAGEGSINHLSGEMFRQRTGMAMTHVPFKGSAPATMELLAGRVDVFFATVPTILAHIKNEKLDLLAVTSTTRAPLFPDTPTLIETGVADFDVSTWWGVLAPAQTPQDIVQTLNGVINDVAAAEPIKGRLVHEGADPMRLTPAQFGRTLRAELAAWRTVARSMRIR